MIFNTAQQLYKCTKGACYLIDNSFRLVHFVISTNRVIGCVVLPTFHPM